MSEEYTEDDLARYQQMLQMNVSMLDIARAIDTEIDSPITRLALFRSLFNLNLEQAKALGLVASGAISSADEVIERLQTFVNTLLKS